MEVEVVVVDGEQEQALPTADAPTTAGLTKASAMAVRPTVTATSKPTKRNIFFKSCGMYFVNGDDDTVWGYEAKVRTKTGTDGTTVVVASVYCPVVVR